MNTWTDARLQRLFVRYNKTYWRGKLPAFSVTVRKLDNCFGRCEFKQREILINVDTHKSDRAIRATVLHEMAHAAAGPTGHGYEFWRETERLLRQRAPVEVGDAEAPGLHDLSGVVPRRFPLARNAMEKVAAARQRALLKKVKKFGDVVQITDGEIVGVFKEAAWEMTEREAVISVGERYGLIDVGANPKNRWASRIIAEGRKAFRASRRDFLEHEKLKKEFERLPLREGTE